MNEKHQQEALLAGLELLCEKPLVKENGNLDYNYKRYRFNGCGHDAMLQPTHVRRGSVMCSPCYEDKLNLSLTRSNLILLKRLKGVKSLVQYKDCGHIREVVNSVALTGSYSDCSECYEQSFANKANEAGFSFVGKYENCGTNRGVTCMICGTYKTISHQQLINGNYECKGCVYNKYQEEAEPEGLTFVARSEKDNCCNTYKLPCGCLKDLRPDHVRNSRWCCDTHTEFNHYNCKSNLYVFKFTKGDFSWLKFGYSRNLDNRLNSYNAVYDDVALLYFKQLASGAKAKNIEKVVHRSLKHLNLNHKSMKKLMIASGFTECYSVSSLSALITEITKELDE